MERWCRCRLDLASPYQAKRGSADRASCPDRFVGVARRLGMAEPDEKWIYLYHDRIVSVIGGTKSRGCGSAERIKNPHRLAIFPNQLLDDFDGVRRREAQPTVPSGLQIVLVRVVSTLLEGLSYNHAGPPLGVSEDSKSRRNQPYSPLKHSRKVSVLNARKGSGR